MDKSDEKTNDTTRKKHHIKLEPSKQIIFRYDDGSEVAFEPTIVNGTMVMYPVEIIATPNTREEKKERIQEKMQPVTKEKAKIIPYGSKLLRAVPIPEEKTPQRIAPNTYPKRYVSLGLVRYGLKHLIVDHETMIQPKEFKKQMLDYSNTVSKPDFGPRTKKELRRLRSTSGVVKLFAMPAHMMLLDKLRQYYTRHCITTNQPQEEVITDLPLLPLGYQLEVDASKMKRISRKRKYPPAQSVSVKSESVDNTDNLVIEDKPAEHSYSQSQEVPNQETIAPTSDFEVKVEENEDETEELDEAIDEDEELTICDENNYVDENGEPVVFLRAKSGKTVFIKKSNLIVMS